ncbi:DNA-directed RNA polymerase, mitochondrial [Psilocybe cubensis]|uniref:DNA-directed RNA polymerase, mitochondrial n=1 Tax=Psilocybe cubensis TaxID=181762 RepID=A0ACB8GN49_PSICU|nr:DNA-directed RNA polymerase, mitochondrial [Psilocybe cubensis]KAH9476822.1 DNA-directed RNA polymerase, mitochondrial [Psilocybe cubensis]
MIPRTARRRLEATLLSARQSLPRPARLYSTPTKRHNAPATASATIPTPDSYPPFIPQNNSQHDELSAFLHRETSLTLLPTPEPGTSLSKEAERWFVDSSSLDMAGIIDACLHNLHDVPRAHSVFQRLRTKVGSTVVQAHMYNAFLTAYTGMAEKEITQEKRQYWIDEAWKLYEVLESEAEEVKPNAQTYSFMLLLWYKFHSVPAKNLGISSAYATGPDGLLIKMHKRNIPVLDVVCNSAITDPVALTAIAKRLAFDALSLGYTNVLHDLGHAPDAVKETNSEYAASVPDVRPVMDSTGEVPSNISGLRTQLSNLQDTRDLLKSDAYARQRQLESSAYDLAKEQLERQQQAFDEMGLTSSLSINDNVLKRWMWEWHLRLRDRLEKDHAKLNKGEHLFKGPDRDVEPYLLILKPDTLSLLTILEVIRLHGSGGVINGMKTARAIISVGKAVEGEHKSQICKKTNIPIPPQTQQRFNNVFTPKGYQALFQRRIAAAQTATDNEGWSAAWSQALRAKVGSVLVDRLIAVAEVPMEKIDPHTGDKLVESHPAFYQSYEYVRGQKLGVIKLHNRVVERLAQDNLHRTIHPRHLPMLVKPRPWIDYNNGAYLINKSYAMRFKESMEQESYIKAATEQGNLELVYAGLDILGSTPWRVNKDIFDSVIKVWNTGERMGKIPPASYEEPEPVLAPELAKDLQARSHHIVRHRAWAQEQANNHSDRCSVNYRLEIAKAFLQDVFYLPHNLDFRGRAYPIPPHLNHMGDDLSRALMMFAHAKPLGVRGLRWLKIHAANLFGYDKARFDERVEWAEEHFEQMREAAKNPLDGSRWWQKADDPWQFLAACIELTKAHELEDPTTYMCALPVHQDGTCNGLQHYAALGGDTQGAEQVNLAAADKPSDVYTFISLRVQAAIDKDADNGVDIARILKDKITRKVVKQTVMTTVYGVTFIGAREQIEKQLRDRTDLPKEICWQAASYIAKQLLSTIGDTFKGAKGIQDWLNLCARLISKSVPASRLGVVVDEVDGKRYATLGRKEVKREQMTSVIWTTMLGLPIVQPYRKISRKQIKTSIQSVYISDPHRSEEVNSQKQATAFPPNFIHSLDATHMLLTAIKCNERGLTFASIHDSYWTHACDIDTMSEAIRETFISLHQSDILNKLQHEFLTRYAMHYIPVHELVSRHKSRPSLLLEKLHHAGTVVYTSEEDAGLLKPLGSLVEVTEDSSKWAKLMEMRKAVAAEGEDEDAALVAAAQEGKKVKKGKGKPRGRPKKAGAEDGEGVVEDLEDDEVDVALREMENEEEMELDDELEQMLMNTRGQGGVYIRLIDLIPPLPEKGDFEVEAIKASPYFFS